MKIGADINIFIIILLALIILIGKTAVQGQKNFKLFYRVIVFFILTLTASSLYYLTEGTTLKGAALVSHFMMIMYQLFGAISAYSWFIFVLHETQFHETHENSPCSPSLKNLYMLPLLFQCILLIGSPTTHWIFYFNEKNQYLPGSILQFILMTGYLFAGASISFIKYIKENKYAQQKNCFYLCLFSLLPLLGMGIDVIFPKANSILPFLVISLIMQYLNLMKKEIFQDPLTKLNNRREFQRHLVKMTKTTRKEDVFLIFFDINDFKSINDTFGHVEGDRALIMIAEMLNAAFSNTKAFIARYGGDEFAVILQKNETEILSYLKKVDVSLATLSASLPYNISLSVGYSVYGEENANTIERLIQSADKKMYWNKEENKKNIYEGETMENFHSFL
ncbi:GGDEF domain-containing protein [Anaerotignum sp.]|uniref:GGDEF domain-containing protein n=1 Tax=Anaerotignum sp. TaxID=2039241 RepID=UPI0028A0305D|nr:GGDEF domain-containing protein [Anaerotignum sp.]